MSLVAKLYLLSTILDYVDSMTQCTARDAVYLHFLVEKNERSRQLWLRVSGRPVVALVFRGGGGRGEGGRGNGEEGEGARTMVTLFAGWARSVGTAGSVFWLRGVVKEAAFWCAGRGFQVVVPPSL